MKQKKERTKVELTYGPEGGEKTITLQVLEPTLSMARSISACRTAFVMATGRESGPALAEYVETVYACCGLDDEALAGYGPDEQVTIGLELGKWCLGEMDSKNS